MFCKVATLDAVFFQSVLDGVIPSNALVICIAFAVLAPLGLFRGPLTVFGAGTATMAILMATPALAAPTGDVSGVIDQTWQSAAQQIKTVVNSVVFPALDMILVVLLFVKIASAYMDYRKHGQMEWAPIAILFAGLIFSLTAPTYIWTILGI